MRAGSGLRRVLPASSLPLAAAVLRAPSFRPRQARIGETFRHSGGGWILDRLSEETSPPAHEIDRGLAALSAVCAERIGGAFWAARPDRSRSPDVLLLRPRTARGASAMLRWGLSAHPPSALLMCAPDTGWARRLATTLPEDASLHLGSAAPWPLLDGALGVCVEGEDPFTLLALGAGIPVRCLTDCDLSGWGLTTDAQDVARRGSRSLGRAAHAALIAGVIYRDPFNGGITECEPVIEMLADWRRMLERTRRIGCCTGMSLWKRSSVAAMLHDGVRAPSIRRSARAATAVARRRAGAVAVWTSREPRRLSDAAALTRTPILHVEDGFLRSNGLGSNFTPPCSIVVDTRAPHYAADVASDLETLLNETTFSPTLIARAERLIHLVNRLGLTKYNVGHDAAALPCDGRRRVLVAGQVEDDLSVRRAGAGVQGNLDLLSRARAAEPGALILFKPHPDVEAGHRRGALSTAEALRYADVVLPHASMAALLGQVDAVHVLTSLTGFEALLRRREVVTHGRPFYAGWGLTRDLAPPSRRKRTLSLAELVAGALILYPFYLDPVSRLPCSPERVAERMANRANTSSSLIRLRIFQGRLRLALNRTLRGGLA